MGNRQEGGLRRSAPELGGAAGAAGVMARRSLWGIADQVTYGVSNAALTFVAARILDPTGFGAFALLYTTTVIVVIASRSLTSEPFAVLHSDSPPETQQRLGPRAAGLSMAVGSIVGVVAVTIGLVLDQPVLVAFGATMPPICVQDYMRYHLVAVGQVRSAFLNDITWVIVQFAAIGILAVAGRLGISTLIIAWGTGATVAAVFARWQLGFLPTPSGARAWWRDTKQYSRSYFAEFVAVTGSGYSIVYIVAGLSGVGAAGAYRGGQALFGPLAKVIGGLRVVSLPEVVRRRRNGIAAIQRMVVMLTLGLGALGLAATFGLELAGDWIGPVLLGETWAAAAALVVPLGLGQAAIGAAVGPLLGLRAIGATARSVRVQGGGSLIGLGLATLGALLGGAAGAAWGLAAGMVGMLVMWQVAFLRAAQTINEADIAVLSDTS